MAWLKIESSVARNRKFVKAGPAPSWLWVCGLAYCQEGLTDGFIPEEALGFLGVKNAKQLAGYLENAGLWNKVDGGWRVHDYLEHNRSAAEVDDIRARRATGGQRGGRPKKEPSEKPFKVREGLTCETFPVDVADGVADGVAVGAADLRRGALRGTPPMDEWWLEFLRLYPEGRRRNNSLTNKLFVDALLAASDGPFTAWDRMRANLSANLSSHEWAVKGMAPAMDKYLDGRWEDVLPASPPMSEATAARLPAWAKEPA